MGATVRSDDHLVALLRAHRRARGMSQADLDARVGWADAYAAKLEAPHRQYGRRVAGLFTASLFDWLQGLGLALVLVDAADAPEPTVDEPTSVVERTLDTNRPALTTRTLCTRITWTG